MAFIDVTHYVDKPVKALDPANDTVAAGYYAATTLSTVDADLAVGNIKSGVTIFGKAGTVVSGTATHDIQGKYVDNDDNNAGPLSLYYLSMSIPSLTEVQFMLELAQTYAANSLAEAFGVGWFDCSGGNALKIRLYMGGVQVAESGYLNSWGLIRFAPLTIYSYKALSGSKDVQMRVYNYSGGAVSLYILNGDTVSGTGTTAAAIFSGSVKVV